MNPATFPLRSDGSFDLDAMRAGHILGCPAAYAQWLAESRYVGPICNCCGRREAEPKHDGCCGRCWDSITNTSGT